MPTRRSPAKINLFLEVVRKRADGYHDIDSVFLEIDLADTLHAAAAATVALACDRTDVPTGDDNLIVKAAELLRRECGVRDGIHFMLEKRIPMGGGLGGGSSNAAAALRLADAVWGTGLSDSDLMELGARIGSDVPFFLVGGACLCRGRGEVVTPLPPAPPLAIGLALPGIHSNTAAAYRGLRLPGPGEARRAEEFVQALAAGDVATMERLAFNRFEPTVFAAFPELARVHAELEQKLSRPVRMSGSGSGMWFFGEVEDGVLGNVELSHSLAPNVIPARRAYAAP